MVFGKLKVIRKTDQRISNRAVWECGCECGNITYVTTSHLTSGQTTSCGCARKGVNAIDLSDRVFGRLTAKNPTNGRMGNTIIWQCDCECGNTAYVASMSLINGSTTSCGCYASEVHSENGKKVIAAVNEINLVDGTNIALLGGKLIKSNTSGVTGVSWDSSVNLWKAKITFKGKIYRLGGFHDIKDAIVARKTAEEKLHGEFLSWYNNTYKKEIVPMRKSLEDIKHMVMDRKYPGLPDELKEFNYYMSDSGHCVLAIPESLLSEAESDGDLDMYECPIPVKYILEKGYRQHKGYLIVDIPYNYEIGININDDYYEF